MKDADYINQNLAPVLSGAAISRRAGERVFQTEWLGLTLFASDEGRATK
ncbi:hypothetical protein ACTVQQ_19560 [Klebsiella pneumoniae]